MTTRMLGPGCPVAPGARWRDPCRRVEQEQVDHAERAPESIEAFLDQPGVSTPVIAPSWLTDNTGTSNNNVHTNRMPQFWPDPALPVHSPYT